MSESVELHIRATAITDIGRMRRRNEDRFLCEPVLHLFGVADGVGGLPSGAQAAQCVVDTFKSQINRQSLLQLSDWAPLIQATNEQVVHLGQLISPDHGIASTFTGGVINGSELWLAHVGDSRCHLINAAGVTTLTEDHSAENEAKNNPDFPTPTERYRASLVRVMGQPGAARPDLSIHPVASGDHLLFATDGITGVVAAEELAVQVLKPIDPAERLARIVALANDRGGPDNATAVLVEFRDTDF